MIVRSTYQLFVEALDVVNAALNANRNSPLIGPLVSARNSLLAGVNVGVVIQSRRFQSNLDEFTIRLKDGNFVLVARGRSQAEQAVWHVSEDYLREVADHPRRYISEPWKLDLDWLRDFVAQRRAELAGNSDKRRLAGRREKTGDDRHSPSAAGRRPQPNVRLEAGD